MAGPPVERVETLGTAPVPHEVASRVRALGRKHAVTGVVDPVEAAAAVKAHDERAGVVLPE